ncbi:type I-E CRISPR-associated protein Cse2/CasB [Nocardia sp. CNY236]|uniref:type I-E CRISPR-associated protein Cse2/CasB n=1 Tax=Nocardia sp. CNY236 TaxID=1169152 RepID=UPI0006868D4C|nr:type I-E CRISPR-associated protein Cse2/CasB [Nocardia sp. CNY236]
MATTKRFGLPARAEAFVGWTEKRILSNPGDRAGLRRALGRSPEDIHTSRAHAVVARFVRRSDEPASERAFYAIAAMMAAQPRAALDADADKTSPPQHGLVRRRETLGATLGRAVGEGILNPGTTESRLHVLCRQPVDGVHRHLPRVIMHLRAELVPVNWSQLLVDLACWPRDRDGIVKRWLQDYYRTIDAIERAKKNSTTGSDSDSDSESEPS